MEMIPADAARRSRRKPGRFFDKARGALSLTGCNLARQSHERHRYGTARVLRSPFEDMSMKTADLIDALATELRPVTGQAVGPLLVKATLIGAAGSLLLVIGWLGVQPGLVEPERLVPFLMKGVYAGAVSWIALLAATHFARPEGEVFPWRWLTLPFTLLSMLALWQLTAATDVPQALLGGSWNRCPLRIAALSVPIVVTVFATLRRQAPTDLRRAGAATGLVAGGAASIVYALACTENSPAFVLIWYSLGIALATCIGALLGPRFLRW